MEEQFAFFARYAALMLEFATVVTVVAGAIIAVIGLVRHFWIERQEMNSAIRQVWLEFAAWILIALEFALGADIVRTAIAPTWDQIGQLGVIAAIRTGLGFFLDRDIEGFRKFGRNRAEVKEEPSP
ncbi:MAG: DUF1622 domain-containing protein [Novosphingobium sp.]